jgi:hypothetical protein
MAFRIYDTISNILNNSVNSVRLGSPMFNIRTSSTMCPVHSIIGTLFKLKSDQELTAFSIKQDMWTGDGDTRSCGIYKHPSGEIIIEQEINKTTAKLINNEYVKILSSTVILEADTQYLMLATIKFGDFTNDSDQNKPPGEADPTNYNYSILLDYELNLRSSSPGVELSYLPLFPGGQNPAVDGISTFNNAYFTTSYT